MVDVIVSGRHRDVTVNFVSIDDFQGIAPTQVPACAQTGVKVAHPIDILASKIAAMSNRRAVRDYWDMACAFQQIPDMLRCAANIYLKDAMTIESTHDDLAKTVLAFPFEVEHTMPADLIAALQGFARMLTGDEY